MKKRITLLVLAIIALQACFSGNRQAAIDEPYNVKAALNEGDTVIKSVELTPTKAQLLGVWTDGTGENATFRLNADSLLNVEHLESFAWELKQDTLIIHYPEELYKGRISNLTEDGFTLEDKYSTVRFKRFSN